MFEIRCGERLLASLSDWLNDNLDFDGGDDFNKLSDRPLDAGVCATSRREIADYLTWAAGVIEGAGDASTRTRNRLRLMRNMAKKIRPT